MFKFRINPRSLLGVLLGIPFIFLILHSKPGLSGDYTSDYYTDSPSRSSSSSSSTNLASGGANPNSLTLQVEPEHGSSTGDNPKQSCVCDNGSSHDNSLPQHVSIVPNKALYIMDRTIIFLITPTYTRPTQMADMTRLAQTLRLVPDVFWIVVEDAHNESKSVEELLQRTNIPYVHLLGPRPPTHMDKRSGRGVSNRLKAFQWLRDNYQSTSQPGVIYFADDDNAYDVRLFEEMRNTQVVSMFPVGLISTLGLSTPIVSQKTGKIIGFHDPFIGRRKFAVDMAGFAVNLQFFLSNKKATMPYKVGYEEDYFLKSLGVKIWQLEPKAKNCTEILVWHTKTKPGDNPKLTMMQRVTGFNETNLPQLYDTALQS